MTAANIKKALRAHLDVETLEHLDALFIQDQYARVKEICNERLAGTKEITRQNREYWYYKAISLDVTGDQFEAISILCALSSTYPMFTRYQRHFEYAVDKKLSQISDSKDADREAINMEALYEFFFEIWEVPLWLFKEWSKCKISKGETKEVKKRALTYLELSPGDVDYLALNLELSILANDSYWAKWVSKRAKELIDKYPYRVELYKLLPKNEPDTKKAALKAA